MRTLDALDGLAHLAIGDTTEQIAALSEATRIIGVAIGSADVRLLAGDGVNFEAYPPRENEDFFGLSSDGEMSLSLELRRLGCSAAFTISPEGLPQNIAPADGSSPGSHVAFTLWKGDAYLGATVVACGPWAGARACRAGRTLELAGPALAIMFDRVVDVAERRRVRQEMHVLADVARVLTRGEGVHEVLQDSVRAINSATAFLSSIDVLDTRGRIVLRSTAAGRYTDTPLYQAWLNMIRAPDHIREMILRNHEPVLLPDLQNDPRLSEEARDFYRRASIVSGATFPLLFQDEVVGLLRVGSFKPEPFDAPVVDLLQNLAIQVAVVVKGVKLREELERSRRKTERYAAKLEARNKDLLSEISERQRAEQALRASEEQYRDLVENLNEVIYSLDKEGRVTYVSPAVERIGGYEPSEVTGRSFTEFVHADDLPPLIESYKRTISGNLEPSEYRMLTKSGEMRWVRTSSRPVLDGDEVVGLRAVLMDITDRKKAENQVEYLAYHDGLTGLPNRTLLKDRVTMALAQRRRDKRPLAVLFLDLDRFKLVNDTIGHAVGDQMLQAVAERLTSIVRDGDTVGRLGGDEFTVLLPAVSGADEACGVTKRILERFRQPFVATGHRFHITASIGVAMYPQDGEDAEALLRNADTAMYRAKDTGRDNFQLFTPSMNTRIREQVRLESDLRQALKRKQLVVYYQPEVNTETGRIVAMEALVRWQHPERGIIYPEEFIPLAEETGLILPLGQWVLRTACAQNKAYQEAGLPPVRVAVNLSTRQFQDPDLVGKVAAVLKETGLESQYLELEITEGTAMRDVEFTIKMLSELRMMGVHVSIDDFGTGYSSLSYMKRLPIDSVKIDGSFVVDSPSDPDDAAIVAAIVALARTLNLRAVAEGVETSEQLAILKERQCHEAQGFLFSEAVPPEAMKRILARRRPLGATPKPRASSSKAA